MNREPARRAAPAPIQSARQLPLANHTTGEQLRTTHTPELVIALCGPIGSPLHDVASTLQALLKDEYGYECQVVRASKFNSDRFPVPEGATPVTRAHHLIQKGNDLREKFGNSVLAELSVRAISIQRERRRDSEQRDKPTKDAPKRFEPNRICHIIDSIKNGAELDTLRLVYGSLLHTVGVFASEQHRKVQLAYSIRDPGEIEKLIERDAKEEGVPHGQSVRSTFPECDYFVRGDGGKGKTDAKLKRLLKLIFGIGVITPSSPEMAMFHAASAAKSSACLSRQVGAAILDKKGQLIAVGWNDVPKYGGGVYKSADDTDCRCCNYRETVCHNDAHKQQIAQAVAEALMKKKLSKLVQQQKSSAVPKDNRSLESFPALEGMVVEHLRKTGVLSQNATSHEEPA